VRGNLGASHRIASHRIASHRIASHRIDQPHPDGRVKGNKVSKLFCRRDRSDMLVVRRWKSVSIVYSIVKKTSASMLECLKRRDKPVENRE
jgi:hypothetical protein